MLFTIGFDMAENLFMSYLCDTVPLLWFQVIPWPKPCHGKNDHVGSLLPDLCGKMHVLWWKISAASQRAPRMTHDYSADHVVKPEETHVLVFIYTSNKQQAVSISVSCVFYLWNRWLIQVLHQSYVVEWCSCSWPALVLAMHETLHADIHCNQVIQASCIP